VGRRRRWFRRAAAAALLLGLVSTYGAASAESTPTRSAGGLIVFYEGGYLHTMRPDGTHIVRLATRYANLSHPAWSADGSKIVVDLCGICTLRADGSHARRLTLNVNDSRPTWSPHGRMIAFQRDSDRGSAIFRINADGSGLTRLTNWFDANTSPAWSPDGTKIAYDRIQEPGGGLWTMKPDGSDKTYVTGATVNTVDPAWSPDGSELAFMGGNDRFDIYVVNSDGTGLRPLTNATDTAGFTVIGDPSWSPDGTQLVFDVIRDDGHEAILRINADGSGLERLTSWRASATEPSWGVAVPWCGGHSSTIVGTAGNDRIVGSKRSDVIAGGLGDDTIHGLGGNDVLCGNAGADTIYGNRGDDVLHGDRGDDVLVGGYGDDTLLGGSGDNRLVP
jgi:Tol biopolymer transport system component